MVDDQAPSRFSLARLVLLLAAWGSAALGTVLVFTEAFGVGDTNWRVVELQALAPYVLLMAVPVALVAVFTRRRALMVTSSVPVLGLVALTLPLVSHPDAPQVDQEAPTVTVLHANLYWQSDHVVQAADTVLDAHADVLALSELTPAMAEALDALGATEDYPYRVGVAQDGTEGIALWSRLPIEDAVAEDFGDRPGVRAVVLVDDRRLRVIVAHPIPPADPDARAAWEPSLRVLNEMATEGSDPTLLVGDMNGGWWHSVYRRTLTPGLVDVHRVLGDGFSVSWPANHRFVPPFTRLDHALTHGAVGPLGIDDLPMPGSDHEAFIVRLAVGEPST